MRTYPAFLNLAGLTCLVVGGGRVGFRKAASLAECSPEQVLVVDPAPASPQMRDLMEAGPVVYAQRPFNERDLKGKHLVFAATADKDLNAQVLAACRKRGILCNRAETPEGSGFMVPAVLRRGELAVAVSTGGASPALARMIRRDLEQWFGDRYGPFLDLMALVRPMIQNLGLPQEANAELFRTLAASDLINAVGRGDREEADGMLRNMLPETLHSRIEELLDGLD